MGWKVSIALVIATVGLPASVAAEGECQKAPAGFNATAEGGILDLVWSLPPDCSDAESGVFRLYRNGELVIETTAMNYTEELMLPVAYTVMWVNNATNATDDSSSSSPSTIILLADDPSFTPFIRVATLDAFIQYISAMTPCTPISWGTQPHIPYLFDIAWNCLPLDVKVVQV